MGPVLLEDDRIMMAGGAGGSSAAWNLPDGWQSLQVGRAAQQSTRVRVCVRACLRACGLVCA